ncbi:hypothetical protein QFC22_001155 [Naganishia vaughanmartiniae]|uniref:Uncharacterized protein n=1 Tax=Naganishia vaughanmartiniae TaxID=1424756 RepID=A0ACC2XL64_9TREE|nr:hypothetical protein QFC22_001155 [Naganishia vaughanmartiniae]
MLFDESSYTHSGIRALLIPSESPRKSVFRTVQERNDYDDTVRQQVCGRLDDFAPQSSKAIEHFAQSHSGSDEEESDESSERKADEKGSEEGADDDDEGVVLPRGASPTEETGRRYRARGRLCATHTAQTEHWKRTHAELILACEYCEMMRGVNHVIQKERRKYEATKKHSKGKNGVPEARSLCPDTINRHKLTEDMIRKKIAEGKRGLSDISRLIPGRMFGRLKKYIAKRRANNQDI